MPDIRKFASPKRIVQALLPRAAEEERRELITADNDSEDPLTTLQERYPGADISTPVHYSSVDWEKLNDFDGIARYILALVYSASDKGTKTEFLHQQLIGIPTVAVACSGGVLHIAHDIVKIDIGQIKDILESINYKKIELIKNNNTNKKLHAEMKILKVLGVNLDRKLMGVSKPCCTQCADFLELQGIDYSYWHSHPVGHWTPPF